MARLQDHELPLSERGREQADVLRPGGAGDWSGEMPRQPPLIEPSVRFSRARLSDGVHVRTVVDQA
jgi:hypothetical protein